MKKLKIVDFTQFYNDIYHAYTFKHKKLDYELCLEPCLGGFCIGLYRKTRKGMCIVAHKQCTNEEGYEWAIFGRGARHPKTWDHAVEIANKVLSNYIKKEGEKA